MAGEKWRRLKTITNWRKCLVITAASIFTVKCLFITGPQRVADIGKYLPYSSMLRRTIAGPMSSSSGDDDTHHDGVNCSQVGQRLKSGELNIEEGYSRHSIYDPNQDIHRGIVEFRPLLNCLDQEDHILIRYIKENLVESGDGNPYKLSKKFEDIEQPSQTMDLLDLVFREHSMEDKGFFIEAGSHDSEWHSISLYFEIVYSWTGLLVEANEVNHQEGLAKNRKASYVNSCLGLKTRPHTANFDFFNPIKKTGWAAMPGLSEKATVTGVKMQCLPLYSLIQAAGNPTVNLFILDVEGAELGVLKTLPWDKVDIQVMTIESDLVGDLGVSGGSQEELRDFVISKGYKLFKHRNNFNNITGKYNNDLFVRTDLVKKWKIKQDSLG